MTMCVLYILANFESDMTYGLPVSTIAFFTVENKEVNAFSQSELIVEAEVNKKGWRKVGIPQK